MVVVHELVLVPVEAKTTPGVAKGPRGLALRRGMHRSLARRCTVWRVVRCFYSGDERQEEKAAWS